MTGLPPAFRAEGSEGPKAHRFGLGLYGAHLLSLFSLAASNVLLGLGVVVAPWTLRDAPPLSRPARRWVAFLGLYVVLILVSVVLSYDPRTSAGTLGGLFNLFTPLLAVYLIRNEKQARFVVQLVILLAAAMAVVGLIQYALGQDNLESRIRGSLSHYMTFAGVLLVGDCLLLAWLVCGDGRKRAWAWVALGVVNLALLVSYTRNAWVALFFVVTALVVAKAPRYLLAYLPVGVLLVMLAPLPVLDRFVSIVDLEDPSNYDRLCMVSAGVQMVAERPIFGIGPDMVSRRYTIYRHPTAPRFWVPHLHNSYLNVAAERGLASLAAFLALLALAVWEAWKGLRREGGLAGPRGDLYAGVLLTALGFCIAGFFEDNWADTEVQRLFLFVLVLPFCLTRETPESSEAREDTAPGPML